MGTKVKGSVGAKKDKKEFSSLYNYWGSALSNKIVVDTKEATSDEKGNGKGKEKGRGRGEEESPAVIINVASDEYSKAVSVVKSRINLAL